MVTTATINAERGDIEVVLDGKSYGLRPTFEALCEIESRTGARVGMLLRHFTEGDIGVFEMTVIL